LGRDYKIAEFAQLAGVTVKALRLYDRLGLLKPRRTGAAYRLYTQHELERLEQIVTLKFLGLPLKQIRSLLDREPLMMQDALRFQRRVLEEKHEQLARAIRVIQEAEKTMQPGQPVDPAVLKRIIGVIVMQDSIDVMKKYYSEEAWIKCRPPYERWLSPESQEFHREVEASLDLDPGSEKAQALATRWIGFLRMDRDLADDPAIEMGMMKAWIDREHWPPPLKQWHDAVAKTRVFMGKVISQNPGKFFSEEDRARIMDRMAKTKFSSDWHKLLEQTSAAAAAGDPQSADAQALATRWRELSGGGIHTEPEKIRAWVERQHWPAETKHLIASIDLEKVASFISQAGG
jgi:DNA-binding transcriptional MerR regulator